MEINDIRTGTGFDVHRFAPQRKLFLCGVEVEHNVGLDGHSDADVAIHALMDAILGAGGYRDIGTLFPDTSCEYKGIDSKILLSTVCKKIALDSWRINNADIVIIAQKPYLKEYIPQMKKVISTILGCDESRVAVKATTTEKLGFTGREEGIAAIANVLLIK